MLAPDGSPMKFLSSTFTLLLVCFLAQAASLCSVAAQDAAEDPDLPKPFDPTQLDTLIANPPFTRSVNPSDSLVLSGLAFIDGKPVATLFDSSNKSSIVVSDQPNAKGWTLNEALSTEDIRRAQAKISIGGEIVSIRYNKDALLPDKLKKERSSETRGPPLAALPQAAAKATNAPVLARPEKTSNATKASPTRPKKDSARNSPKTANGS